MRRLSRVCAALGALVAASTLFVAHPASAQDATKVPPINVIEVTGLLDPVQADFIEKAIDRAESQDVQALVIQLNSKKAVIDDDQMAALLDDVAASKVPIAIWVGPSGARAYQGSGQLLLVAGVTGISPGSRVGNFGDPLDATAFTVSDKATIDKWCCSSLGAAEAVAAGVIDLNSPVLGQFIVGLDGLDVNGTTLHTAQIVQGANGPRSQPIAQVRFSKLDLLPRLLHTVASPPVAYLMLTIGLVLLVFEFYVAGVGIAGGVGALFLVLSVYGLNVLPTRPAAAALILFSMLAFAIDVQTGVPRVLDRRGHRCVHRRQPPPLRRPVALVDHVAVRDRWSAPRDARRDADHDPHEICHTNHRPRVDDRRDGHRGGRRRP